MILSAHVSDEYLSTEVAVHTEVYFSNISVNFGGAVSSNQPLNGGKHCSDDRNHHERENLHHQIPNIFSINVMSTVVRGE